MAPRLSGQTSLFVVVFFVFKFLSGNERQRKLKKFIALSGKPRNHVRILLYRGWPIHIVHCPSEDWNWISIQNLDCGFLVNKDFQSVSLLTIPFCYQKITYTLAKKNKARPIQASNRRREWAVVLFNLWDLVVKLLP